MESVTARYIGPHGRLKWRAAVDHVGDVYYQQIVNIPKVIWDRIAQEEWQEVEKICAHIKLDGTLCGEPRLEGSDLCQFHLNEIRENVKLPSPLVKREPNKNVVVEDLETSEVA